MRESEEQGPTTMAVVLFMEGWGRKEAGEVRKWGQTTKLVADDVQLCGMWLRNVILAPVAVVASVK